MTNYSNNNLLCLDDNRMYRYIIVLRIIFQVGPIVVEPYKIINLRTKYQITTPLTQLAHNDH